MSVSPQETRLRILEGLLPSMTRLGINQPEIIICTANALEKYVTSGYASDNEDASSSAPVKRRRRRKQIPEDNVENPAPSLD